MKLCTNGERIAVVGRPTITGETLRYPLAIAPGAIGETVRLETDTGMELRSDNPADWLRAYLDGADLVLTNLPERTPAEPGLEELREAKLAELNAACDSAIAAGCAVTLTDGATGHISLTIPDQINLSTAQGAIQAGRAGYAYHLDGALCQVYPAADIALLAGAAKAHVLYHQTYCNHLRSWAQRTETAAALAGITYGGELPEDLKVHMAAVLAAAEGGVVHE